jgi:hypothetical protein
LCWCKAYWYPIKNSLLESTGIPVPLLIADMIILHSPVETYIFSFSFLLLFLRLLPCVLTTMLSTPSLSYATSVMITHTLCTLLETPPFRVVKSTAEFLLKFWLKSEWSITSPWRVSQHSKSKISYGCEQESQDLI